jgi:hypothetical protein
VNYYFHRLNLCTEVPGTNLLFNEAVLDVASARRRGSGWHTMAAPIAGEPGPTNKRADPQLGLQRRRWVVIGQQEVPTVVLQRWAAVHGDGAAALAILRPSEAVGVAGEQ